MVEQVSVAIQAGLSCTWLESPKTSYLTSQQISNCLPISIVNSLKADYFIMLLSSADFFEINFFKTILSEKLSECQMRELTK